MQRLRRLAPFALALICFIAALWTLPAAWCRRGAASWFQGDTQTQISLAKTVALQTQGDLSTSDYKTGSARFDGEWLFGTHVMAGIGFCQLVRQHPETKAEWSAAIEHCIRQLLSKQVREFDHVAWDADAIESLDQAGGHVAYLGYLNFLLSLYREIEPANEFTSLNDQITAALIRRYTQSDIGLLETYPGEWYPVDNAAALGSIAVHARATGRDYSALLQREKDLYRTRYIESSSGLLIQAINEKGYPRNQGRGSGTALGIFFIHHAYPDLGKELYRGITQSLESSLFNFGAIREYPHGEDGISDIDSGPIILGFGFSATGFTIGAARAYGDSRLYSRLYSSAVLAGAPSLRDGRLDFLTGGSLGNAILLAMLTTAPIP